MRITRRLRFRLLTMMGLVALAAMLLGLWTAAERRSRMAALAAELHRLQDRVSWAEKMQKRGYISPSKLVAEQNSLTKVQTQLQSLGVPAEGL